MDRETTTEIGEIDRAKRAVVVLMEVFEEASGGKKAPLELRKDVQALIRLIRKAEAL